jgi:hypothetical protein
LELLGHVRGKTVANIRATLLLLLCFDCLLQVFEFWLHPDK